MVTERATDRKSSVPFVRISVSSPFLSVEELEQRLETSLARIVHAEPCNCLGALCHCDGQDCVGVCETYCLIHYV
jgi:hypothetical protein